jgi:nicotinamidase/pyrazinamidase
MQRVHLVIIDPQVDFMDTPDSALPVAGASNDMKRVAGLVKRIGRKLDGIHVTYDSHRVLGIERPGMWVNGNGDYAPPFTMISSGDIESGIWLPRNGHLKPGALGGKSIKQYMVDYARALEQGGKYALMVWPRHCVIGTPGYAMQADLFAELADWEVARFATVNSVVKGTCMWTEHYGALSAEVPLATDPTTGLNTRFLDVLAKADIVVIAGEALSHCVMSTVNQIADGFGPDLLGKIHLLTDGMSPVGAVPGGPDFPVIGADWLKQMERQGMRLTTTDTFLA